MRRAFAHEAVLIMGPDADLRAPGAAITLELCGQWEHQPPCPLAPHHTRAERIGGQVRIRTLFASEPDAVDFVRQRIDTALSRGQLAGPHARITRWQLDTSQPSDITADEADHAERLRNN